MATASNLGAIVDPAEVAYWQRRRVVRRRQFWAIVVAAVLATGFVGWRVGSHVVAAWWLEANQYVVLWGIDRGNWKGGGVTTVRYSARPVLFGSTRPNLDLKFLTNLHHLEELDLSTMVGIRDADMANLDDLTGLRRLNVDRSRQPPWGKLDSAGLTDATLARIGRLSRLRDLNLGGQKFTDSGLKGLAGLDQLESLDLVETAITDAGLEPLKGLRRLKSLDLTRTKVTAQGVRNFEAAKPGVKVVADPPLPASPSAPSPRTNP